jgi:hypothetical protein
MLLGTKRFSRHKIQIQLQSPHILITTLQALLQALLLVLQWQYFRPFFYAHIAIDLVLAMLLCSHGDGYYKAMATAITSP